MSAGPDQPQGPQWNPQDPAGWPGQAGWPAQGQNGWPGQAGQGQTQDQYAWQPQAQARPQGQPQPYGWSPVQPGHQPAVMPKNPGIGVLLSFFIPGLGSMVNGNSSTGAIILVVWIAGWILSLVLIGIPIAIGAWIWGMVDGYRSAQDWNRAHGIIS
jgi:TM2 domain-containing membrane protein YozV